LRLRSAPPRAFLTAALLPINARLAASPESLLNAEFPAVKRSPPHTRLRLVRRAVPDPHLVVSQVDVRIRARARPRLMADPRHELLERPRLVVEERVDPDRLGERHLQHEEAGPGDLRSGLG